MMLIYIAVVPLRNMDSLERVSPRIRRCNSISASVQWSNDECGKDTGRQTNIAADSWRIEMDESAAEVL
jgi:hypothetical protein